MKKLLLLAFILLGITSMTAFGQGHEVSGKVTSAEDGTPLPGVNVIIKGTPTGTVTDADGNFSINVPDANTILIFTFIGLESQEITVGERSVVDVQLRQDVTQLSEVVVTALGLEAQKDKVGLSSSSISGTAISGSGETGLLNSMAGKTTGVNITSNSGDPGAGSRIVIRGATSITQGLQPLIIVDGVPISNSQTYGVASSSVAGVTQQSRINDINPNDIESIEILKGASAAAVWGARAANGVVIITTKSGKSSAEGKFSIDFTSRFSADVLNKEVPLQYEYGQGFGGLYRGGFISPSSGMSFSWGDKIADRSGGADDFITNPADPNYRGKFTATDGRTFYRILDGSIGDPHGGKNDQTIYNHHDDIFKTGLTWYNSLGIGTNYKNGNAYLSFSNTNQNGIIEKNSDYERQTLRLNATQFINKFTFNTNVGYTRTNSDRIQMGSNIDGLLLGSLRTPADFDNTAFFGTYEDANGNVFENRQRAYRNPLGRRTSSSYDNPLWMMRNITSNALVNRVQGKVELGYDPLDWLNFTGRVGLDTYTDERNDYFDPLSAGYPGGYYAKQTIQETVLQSDFFARAKYEVNENFSGNALIGVGISENKSSSLSGQITSFVNPSSPPDLGNATADSQFTGGSESETRNLGYYATLGFDLFDQLFLNFTGRYDFWSTFSEKNNSFFYPAADLAWQFSKLLPDSKFFSFGKLRLAYGTVGRAPGPYVTNSYFISSSYGEGWGGVLDGSLYGGAFRRSARAGNPDIKPETKTEFEIGADLRFLDNRIDLSATYYNNVTSDLIVSLDVANSSGFSSKVANGAEIKNHGIEIELGGDVIRSNNFQWGISLNWFSNRNEVTNMLGVDEISLAGFTGSTSSAVLGDQLGVLYGDRWDRDTNGDLILDSNGFPQLASTPGVIGDPNPDWRGSFINTLKYKNFSLSVLIEHSQGGDVWNGTRGALAYFGRAGYTGQSTTITQAEATTLVNWDGVTVADMYPDSQNGDGTYTFRGEVKDFGAGPVIIDETWYWDGPGSGFTGPTEQFIEDATWTRIREVTLTYDFSSLGFLSNVGITGASLSVTGRNLALWTNYTGIDPDTNLPGARNGFGIDYFNNPSTKSYQVTLNIKF